jgi:hypothetical protein
MNGLDAVALGIMRFEGGQLQDRNMRNCNPGNLRASALTDKKDSAGYCVFPNMSTGYLALLRELRFKFTGQSSTGITPDSTLLAFFDKYAPAEDSNDPLKYAGFIAQFIAPVKGLQFGVSTRLSEIWTPEDGLPWDSQLSKFLSL